MPVALREFAEAVCGRWRTRFDRLVVHETLDVTGQAVGRLVAPRAFLLERSEYDPVQLAAQRFRELRGLGVPRCCDTRQRVRGGEAGAGFGRLLFANQPANLVPRRLLESVALERRRARQQLVQDHAQSVNI